MDVKKINFKDRKYVFPAILYPLILFVGYFIIDTVNTDVSDNDPRLKTTDYLNSDLPAANTDSVLGGKLDNAEREYGQINDLSGVENIENDRDSINKKRITTRNTVPGKRKWFNGSRNGNVRSRKNSVGYERCKIVSVEVMPTLAVLRQPIILSLLSTTPRLHVLTVGEDSVRWRI